MTPLRKAILLIVYVAMILGGLVLLADQVLFAPIIFGRFLFGGGFLVFLGIYLLWEDHLSPIFTRKKI